MCLAVPAEVVDLLPDDHAIASLGGVRIEISLALVDEIEIGDFVIVHTGYALSKLDAEEAARTMDLFRKTGLVGGADSPRPGPSSDHEALPEAEE